MRERVSFLMVIFVQFCPSSLYSKPLFRALFPHFKSASRRFPTWLEFHFANSDAHSAWNAHQSPRIGRGDNTDQLSFRSSSVLTALRAPNVRFPTLCALRFTLYASGACLPALPTALSPPTSSCQIVDAICIYPFSLLRRICWGSHFFQRSGFGSNLEY